MSDTKISALTAAAALGGTEAIPGVQTAANVKITAAQVKTFVSASPTLVTPALGVATGTSIAIGGATIGTDALGVTGTASISGNIQVPTAGGVINNAGAGKFSFINANIPAMQSSVGDVRVNTDGSLGIGTNITLKAISAGVLQHGAADVDTNASIVAQTIRSQGALAGGTSDQAGKDFTYIASPGKGTGAGGKHIFQTALAGSTGTVVNTPTNALVVNGQTSNVCANTATPAAGAAAAVLLFGTTAGFGIYYGSGAPTVSAAQGSIYLRSDGSSTSTRMYVNTTGSTTWTNVTTAA